MDDQNGIEKESVPVDEDGEVIFPPPSEREAPVILIADDDPDILNVLSLFFGSKNCHLVEASDGEDALLKILLHHPDLLILDVMMPGLNGWQLCKYVKTDEKLQDIGVLMLTAIGPVNNELTSPIFGADEYIDKPFEFDELAYKVRKVLSARHKQYNLTDYDEEIGDESKFTESE